MTTTAREALDRLQEGNRRFASDMRSAESLSSLTRRAELVTGQQPFAIVLGCSDSRVPAEIVFDQGLGDLFVIRVAGNIVPRSPGGLAGGAGLGSGAASSPPKAGLCLFLVGGPN